MKNKLAIWSGSFNEDDHRYFRADGKELQGITGILHRRIFKDQYKGVSQAVLMNAAERGHFIHSRIELFDNTGLGNDIPEVMAYSRLKELYELEHLASEYLISDDEHYATAIDKVFHGRQKPENEVTLGDIKTTYNLNREYLSWQLSIEAEFFESMNPTMKVTELLGIWVRNDKKRGMIAKVVPVERKPSEVVKELLRCDIEDREFAIDILPSYITDNLDKLVFLDEQIKLLTAERDEIKQEIFNAMRENNAKSVDAGIALFTCKEGVEKKTFDSKRFKEEHQKLYEKYVVSTKTKESLQITIRN